MLVATLICYLVKNTAQKLGLKLEEVVQKLEEIIDFYAS